MKVIVKKPHRMPEIRELNGIREINKTVGNVDENGNGYPRGGSDIRMGIADSIDLYLNENASYNGNLEPNLWVQNDRNLLCGTVVFAGYDASASAESGACSLTQEQIDICMDFIRKCSD